MSSSGGCCLHVSCGEPPGLWVYGWTEPVSPLGSRGGLSPAGRLGPILEQSAWEARFPLGWSAVRRLSLWVVAGLGGASWGERVGGRRKQQRARSQGLEGPTGEDPRALLAQGQPRGLAPEGQGQGQRRGSPALSPHLKLAAHPSSCKDFSTHSLSRVHRCLLYSES